MRDEIWLKRVLIPFWVVDFIWLGYFLVAYSLLIDWDGAYRYANKYRSVAAMTFRYALTDL